MVSISGSKKLKRQMAPLFWGITRKEKRFVITVRPGPHSKHLSIPSAVFLRDTIKIVTTLREAKSAIYAGKIKVDGIVQKSLHHGIGLMDVVELENVDDIYRLVPGHGALLTPLKISADEKTKKLCKVTSKATIKGGRMQIGFHDGKTIISDADVNVGDTCVMQIPDQKILDIIKLQKGAHVVLTKGTNVGRTGTVEKIEDGTFNLPKRALVSLGDRKIETQTDNTMAVGENAPVIKIK